jgi:hypothetical protein
MAHDVPDVSFDGVGVSGCGVSGSVVAVVVSQELMVGGMSIGEAEGRAGFGGRGGGRRIARPIPTDPLVPVRDNH